MNLFGVTVDGLEEYRRDLGALRERLERPVAFAKLTARRLRACFAENFNAEGRPEKWTPLAPSTLADKQRLFDAGLIRGRRRGIRVRLGPGGEQRGGLPGILMRSGLLKDSVARLHSRGNIERIRDDGKTVEAGTSIPYGVYHDQGGDKAYTIMPKAGKILAFYGIDRRTGQPGMIFTRGPVRHPPLPRRSFLVITDDTWDTISQDARDFLGLSEPAAAGSGGE